MINPRKRDFLGKFHSGGTDRVSLSPRVDMDNNKPRTRPRTRWRNVRHERLILCEMINAESLPLCFSGCPALVLSSCSCTTVCLLSVWFWWLTGLYREFVARFLVSRPIFSEHMWHNGLRFLRGPLALGGTAHARYRHDSRLVGGAPRQLLQFPTLRANVITPNFSRETTRRRTSLVTDQLANNLQPRTRWLEIENKRDRSRNYRHADETPHSVIDSQEKEQEEVAGNAFRMTLRRTI